MGYGNDDDALWNFMAGIVGFFAVVLTVTLFRGFVLSRMWEWFIMPFGVASLGMVHAIGLSLIVSFLTYQHDAKKSSSERSEGSTGQVLVKALVEGCLYTAMVWGMGAVVHSFM